MAEAFHERRVHARYALQTRWNVFHLPSGRTFHCRCLDVSAGGARLAASMTMPVREDHEITLLPGEDLDDRFAGFTGADEIEARVVWVNRHAILSSGEIEFAAAFTPAAK